MSSELKQESTAKLQTVSELGPESPIENEIANYRAIHPLAVIALLCGVVGIFSFTNLLFIAFAVAGVVFGLIAVSRVQASPDIYAGAALAKAGIVFGLVCGLSSFTMDFVWKWNAKRSAEQFARSYVDVLAKLSAKDALWYRLDPDNRSRTTKDDFYESFLSQASSGDPASHEMMLGPIEQVHRAIRSAGPGAALEFEEVESAGFQDLNAYAFVRVLLKPGQQAAASSPAPPAKKDDDVGHDPKKEDDQDHEGHNHADGKADDDHDHDQGMTEAEIQASIPPLTEPTHMLLSLKALVKGGSFSWWVQDINYPYQSRTKEQTTTIDHGHSHGS